MSAASSINNNNNHNISLQFAPFMLHFDPSSYQKGLHFHILFSGVFNVHLSRLFHQHRFSFQLNHFPLSFSVPFLLFLNGNTKVQFILIIANKFGLKYTRAFYEMSSNPLISQSCCSDNYYF